MLLLAGLLCYGCWLAGSLPDKVKRLLTRCLPDHCYLAGSQSLADLPGFAALAAACVAQTAVAVDSASRLVKLGCSLTRC